MYSNSIYLKPSFNFQGVENTKETAKINGCGNSKGFTMETLAGK
jgi:hypothetical protein